MTLIPTASDAACQAQPPHAADQAERLRALVREIVEGKPMPDGVGVWANPAQPSTPRQTADPRLIPAGPAPCSDGRPRAATLAIASGKGGVGKTTLAVNLACALAQRSVRVCLIDGDLGLGNADVLLGLNPRLSLAHALHGSAPLDEILLTVPVAGARFTLLPGGSGLAELADLSPSRRDGLAQILRGLETGYDLLIIDCGAGIGASVLSFLHAADASLIVTTPEPTAITDAYALIKCLRLSPERDSTGACAEQAPPPATPIAVVVNQADDHANGAAVQQRLEAVCSRFLAFKTVGAGSVRRDAAAVEAVRRRRPVLETAPHSTASDDIRGLSGFVAALCGVGGPPSERPARSSGLMARLLRVVTRS